MIQTTHALSALALVTAAMILIVLFRPEVLRRAAGRALAFIGFFVLPLLVTLGGANAHVEGAKTTGFCLSCHEMEPYGRSLRLDSREHLPARHFQDRLVSRDQACFTCHTEYTLFGGFRAKLRGLKHVYVHYLGTPPAPEDMKLYEPFANRECLHCHQGARAYEGQEAHVEEREGIASGELSCMECHDEVHAVDELAEAAMWSGAPEEGQ